MKKCQKILLILSITISLFFIGCTGNSINEYKLDLNEFPSDLVDHFPKDLPHYYIIKKNNDVTNECISYILVSIQDEAIGFQGTSLERYSASDSNLITVKRKVTMSPTWGNVKKVFYTDTILGSIIYYPIPYFEQTDTHLFNDIKIYSEATVSGLCSDFDIYILDFQNGNYWSGLKPLSYMPDGWKEGYSKGICINKKIGVIIYWVIIW